MDELHGINITTRDRVLRAWESSMELVRDYQLYARGIQDRLDISALFAEYAEQEAVHAARLLEILHAMEA